MNFWNNFAAKHPAAAKWVREGGLFVIVSNLITVFKYLLLQFLPKAFASLPVVDFGWPGIDITLFGETFKWNILGYDAAHGGLPYFCAYMVAMVIGECINFPIQRSLVFRSKGNLAKQIGWYLLAFCLITCIVNSINCIWVAVAGLLVPDFIYNIGTTVLDDHLLLRQQDHLPRRRSRKIICHLLYFIIFFIRANRPSSSGGRPVGILSGFGRCKGRNFGHRGRICPGVLHFDALLW